MTHLKTGIPISNIYRWMSKVEDYSRVKNSSKVKRIGYEGITVYHNKNGWMTSKLTQEWLLFNRNQVLINGFFLWAQDCFCIEDDD